MSLKRIVLFVEGDSDLDAVPVLVRRILNEINPWEYLWLDHDAFRVHGVENLSGNNQHKWLNWLGTAYKRGNVGAILLLLDGDADKFEGQLFCASIAARTLAERARDAGAGKLFSLACVFACRELESWLIAGVESLRGKLLPDGRSGVRSHAPLPEADTEITPRGAKEWLDGQMDRGYKSSTDLQPLTQLLDLNCVRKRNPRSFRRLENAVHQLAEAIRTGNHIS